MPNKERKYSHHILQKPLLESVFAFSKFEVYGHKNLEILNQTPAIFPFGPHCGHPDTLAVLKAFPESLRPNLVFLSAADYWNKNRLINFLAQSVADMYPLPRTGFNKQMFKKIFGKDLPGLLELQKSIVFSPEGTRNLPEMTLEERKFKSGLGALVVATKGVIPVMPIKIIGAEYFMPKGKIFPNIPILMKGDVCIIFGEPLIFESSVSTMNSARARKYITQEVKQAMIDLEIT